MTNLANNAPKQPLHVVVVGHGMASHAFCRAVASLPGYQRPRVTVIGDEPVVAYNRVRLSDVMGGIQGDALSLDQQDWYEAQGIELRLGDPVVTVDRDRSVVVTRDGGEIAYDRLVLATGSAPIRPPVSGVDHRFCFVYRTLADLAAIQVRAAEVRSAAVIGGGLLGLEAAKVLLDRGLSVTVIEAAKSLMHRQLDADSGAVLRDRVQDVGVKVLVGAAVAAIEDGPQGVVVRLRDGTTLDAGMVVIAAGVSARDGLARDTGLPCAARGGVIVDEAMTTIDPRVYAIGECASLRGQVFGLYAPCRLMAEVAAAQLAGRVTTMGTPDLSCHLKLLGIEVVALGDYGNEHHALARDVGDGRRTLLLREGRLVGAVAVGPWPELSRVERAVATRKKLSRAERVRFEATGELWRGGSLPVAEWPDAAVVCNCVRVTAGELRACAKLAAPAVEVVAARTGATTVCGSCKPLVAALVGDATKSGARMSTWGIVGLSIAAMFAALWTWFAAPIAFADSVQSSWTRVDALWRDASLKQATGFAVIGVAALGGVLSLRKRASWMRWGSFALYRSLHGCVGLLTLVVLWAHTGFRLGSNLNLWLMTVFLSINVLGAMAGLASGLEARVELRVSEVARRYRRPLSWMHLMTFWPLPILLGWHVFTAYYF